MRKLRALAMFATLGCLFAFGSVSSAEAQVCFVSSEDEYPDPGEAFNCYGEDGVQYGAIGIVSCSFATDTCLVRLWSSYASPDCPSSTVCEGYVDRIDNVKMGPMPTGQTDELEFEGLPDELTMLCYCI